MIGQDVMEQDGLKQVFESINSAILVVGPDESVQFANSKALEILDAKTGDMFDLPIRAIFPPEDRGILVTNILNITRKNKEFETEAMLTALSGRKIMVLLATCIAFWDDESIVFSIHDISGKKELERFLRQSERMAFLGRMLDDISHQIRNPVLSIGGFARRLAKIEGCRRDYVDAILSASARLELLLSTLNAFIALPRAKPRLITVDKLMEKVNSCLEDIFFAREGSLEVKIYPDSDWQVLVDPDLFGDAMVAIISNAFESYLDNSNTSVLLTCTGLSEGKGGVFVVEDFGVGISPQHEFQIFDPFFTTKTGHIGMGLTRAKRIIEEQQGEINVESEIGKGTRVMVSLKSERRRKIRTELIEA